MDVNHLISSLAWSRSALSPSRRSERFCSFCESAPIVRPRAELWPTAT